MLYPLFCVHCGHSEIVVPQQEDVLVRCASCDQPADAPSPTLSVVSQDLEKRDKEPQNPAELLGTILAAMKEKRIQARQIDFDLQSLEYQAGAIGEWLARVEKQHDAAHSARTVLDLQYRLFDRLQSLKAGAIEIVDCDAAHESSLASFIAGTFEAFGWTVNLTCEPLPATCGEEITLIVGPGPVSYPVASLHLALLGAGFRLVSRINPHPTNELPRLEVHRLSRIPRVLPAPKASLSQTAPLLREDLRKSA